MRIKIDGGFIEAKRIDKDKIGVSIGSEHFNPDGTRKETVINTASLSEDELSNLFSDIFPSEIKEEEKAKETVESQESSQ